MNTASRTSIYNMALAAIGVSRYVNSPNDGSVQANVCNLFWDAARDQALQSFPWGFAMKYNTLQLLTIKTPFYAFTYGYPSDCLQARCVLPPDVSSLVDMSLIPPGYQSVTNDCFWWYWSNPKKQIPFTIIANESGGGLGIATNLPDAVLAYTGRITTVALWTPAFVNALTWLLASKVAAPLAASPEYAKVAGETYEAMISRAGAMAMNEGHEVSEPESEFITERY